MQKEHLYFVDFYVPNEGESETALEVAVLCLKTTDKKPFIFLHSFIMPPLINRVRWNEARAEGIERELITKSSITIPSLQDLMALECLKDKHVICFNQNIEPVKSFVANAHTSESILELWNSIFEGNEDAMHCTKVSHMLDYLNFEHIDSNDNINEVGHNNTYTALLKRLFAMIAIYDVLSKNEITQELLLSNNNRIRTSDYWPLYKPKDIKVFDAENKSFKDIDRESLDEFFSVHMADYLNWYNFFIYDRGWNFDLAKKAETNISALKGKIDMTDFIYNRVFSFSIRLWVLVYYALYDKKLSYAKEIALKDADFSLLPQSIKEDFSTFLVKHLDEFLTRTQKYSIIRSMIHQSINNKANIPYQDIDFDNYKKLYGKDRHFNMRFIERKAGPQCAVKAFREIQKVDKIIYRSYQISGDDNDRNDCIIFINHLFREFMQECANPFSPFFTDSDLNLWILFITGFSFEDIARKSRASDSTDLLELKASYIEFVQEANFIYINKLKKHLTMVIKEISKDIYKDFCDKFCFMGTSIDIIVSKKQGSFLKRLFNI